MLGRIKVLMGSQLRLILIYIYLIHSSKLCIYPADILAVSVLHRQGYNVELSSLPAVYITYHTNIDCIIIITFKHTLQCAAHIEYQFIATPTDDKFVSKKSCIYQVLINVQSVCFLSKRSVNTNGFIPFN